MYLVQLDAMVKIPDASSKTVKIEPIDKSPTKDLKKIEDKKENTFLLIFQIKC